MQENLNMKVSQFVDDELDLPQAVSLIKEVQNDAQLVRKLNRYRTISQAMKSEKVVMLDVNFSERISRQIKQEAVHFVPLNKTIISWKKTSLALAASLALLAVLLPRTFTQSSSPSPATEQASLVAQQRVIQQRDAQLARARAYVNSQRFHEYLQAHSNSIYTIGASNYQSYARVAGYNQDR